MNEIGTCDLCNGQISLGAGYVFYSATVPPNQTTETGGMHLCEECTEKYINDQQFHKPLTMPSMTAEEFANDFSKALKWMKEANALGIVSLCKALGLTSAQAKEKAREFALLLWKDKQKAIRESTKFWTSNVGQESQGKKDDGCFIATACYGSAFHQDVRLLRSFRDEFLIHSTLGNLFIKIYYRFSPYIARKISNSSLYKATAMLMIVFPAISIARFTKISHSWIRRKIRTTPQNQRQS